jgi:hypothetical protein
MTRILLRPAELPRYPMQSHQLHGDWHWWKLRLPLGDEPIQAWDPDRENIREASVTFNRERDPDTTLLNPPVMRLITTQRVADLYNDIGRDLPMGLHTDIFIVWWGCPGPDWYALPGNTCRPGDYRVDHIVEVEGQPRRETRMQDGVDPSDMHELRYFAGQPLLDWPHTVDLTRFEEESPVASRLLTREELATAFGVPVEYLSPNRIRQLEELQPLYEGPATVSPGPNVMAQIVSAMRDYETQHRSRPVSMMISPEDYRRLLAQTLPPELEWQPDSRTVMGLEVRVERNLPPGRVLMVGPTGNLAEVYGGQLDDVLEAWQEVHQPQQFPRAYGLGRYADPSRLRELPPGSRYSRRPDPRLAPKSENPEQPVLDEIDRQINEQLSEGPRDDYRRPWVEECELCGEQWHGLTGTGEVSQFGNRLGAYGCPGAFATEDEIKEWRGRS